MVDFPVTPPLASAAHATLKDKKILWIEDDYLLGGIVGPRCTDLGIQLHLASDGESALQALQKDAYDLIVLDLMLPKVDGFAILEKMKTDEKTKNIPVVVLSNLGEAEQVEKAKKMGAKLFLVKADHSLDEILNALAEALK